MKLLKTCTLVLAAGSMLFMSSCDSNKGKSKELTEQFLVALNDGDKAGIYDLYPTAKAYTNLEMVTEMAEGDLSVAQSQDGDDVPVYEEANTESKVVKKLKSGTKVMYDYDFASQMNTIYEADGKGGYKVVGFAPMELIQFEESEMETP